MSKVKYSGWGLMSAGGKIDPEYYSHYRQELICLIEESGIGWWKYLRNRGYKIVKVNLIKGEK